MEFGGNNVRRLVQSVLASAAIAVLLGAIAPANAGSLSNGNGTDGQPTGNYLFGYYVAGVNKLDLIDPNGCGNGTIGNAACHGETDSCAMIYVFDTSQEMQGCCGCRVTPNEHLTGSISAPIPGMVVIVGSAINNPGPTPYSCADPANFTCNYGCDPTVASITAGDTNLIGSTTHLQIIGSKHNLTEVPLFDQGAGDAVDDAYLVNECGALAGNGSEQLICSCSSMGVGG
jgi:hypothetical protein